MKHFKVKKFSLIFIAILMFLGPAMQAQKLSVETLIDTNIITIGDQIQLHYSIEKHADLQTWIPQFSDTLIKGIEIIGLPEIDSSSSGDDHVKIDVGITITSFDTGIYYIPPQYFAFQDGELIDTLMSRATYLMVVGVPIDTTQTIRDIKAYERMPVTFGEIALYSSILLLAAAAVWFLIFYLKRRKEEKPIFRPSKPEEPAYVTAFRELDKLKAMKLWQHKQVKEYYTRITYIIRWYIEKTFSVMALELTSDEILDHFKDARIDHINYTNLEKLLNLADLVKFAKGDPDPEENLQQLENAYDFIKRTKEAAASEVPENENLGRN